MFGVEDGFDIVIGNPPHGADLSKYINTILPFFDFYDSRKNSASFFICVSSKLLKQKGISAYIIPKSLSFVEGWKKTREFICDKNQLIVALDISKSFENVLLEQVVIIYKKLKNNKNYQIKIGCGWNKSINILGRVEKNLIKKLDIIPCYLDDLKLAILNKLQAGSIPLSKISKTFRGLPWQRKVGNTGEPILRGKNIGKYFIKGEIDKISLTEKDKSIKKVCLLKQPKIVSQNIVAHVMSPYDHIIIMATLDKNGILTLDTCMNTILTDHKFSYEYILAILNSQLASWFYYWFVYNRAIRTMDFDKYYIGKLPIKILSETDVCYTKIISLVNEILDITKDRENYVNNTDLQLQVKILEKEINNAIYEIYNLTEKEIKIIERGII